MKRVAFLYAAVGGAAVIAAVGVPWLVHSRGSAAVAGWQGLVNPGQISSSHAFIADQCEACHVPHKGVDDQKCVACHAAGSFQDKQSTRFHAQAGRCQACHVEHQGTAAPTRMDHAALLDPKIWRPEMSAAVPHQAWSLRRYLVSPTHGRQEHLNSNLQCSACHAVQDPHKTLFGSQCGNCHGVESWTIAAFKHPAMGSTECAECHRPPPSHSMMHFSMVSQSVAGRRARVEQCYACHATDAWNNIRGRGYYKHH